MQTSFQKNSLKGVYTALITPFMDDGSIDWRVFDSLLEKQMNAGVSGVVINGTTAESPTLSPGERRRCIDYAIQKCRSSLTIIAGTGSNNTAETIEFTKAAGEWGAHAALVVVPYYNKPTPSGLYAHFSRIADQSAIPIILYNVPSRTSVSLDVETIGSLSLHENIIGIKEATGKIDFLKKIKKTVAQKRKSEFYYLSGDDVTFLPFMKAGGDGIISVASNIIPKNMQKLYSLLNDGNSKAALKLFNSLKPMLESLFIESNPAPIKTLMARRDGFSPYVRLPLVGLTQKNSDKLFSVWSKLPQTIQIDSVTKGQK